MTVVVESSIECVQGFQVAGVKCGVRAGERPDFALVVSDRPCVAAGVFTTNLVKAAPVLVDQDVLQHNAESIRVVAVNTGCANACTGRKGIQDAHVTQQWVGQALGVRQEAVLVMSTGVIGTHLPMDKMRVGVDLASRALGNDWLTTATAILTTDTRPKLGSVRVELGGGTVTLAGICKGAGMIAPNMATMLGLIVTDAALTPHEADKALRAATDGSFNCIVVDGDMSTNDTVLLLANGASGIRLESADDAQKFQDALNALCCKLAQDIVRDGEGVTKFITVNVVGAPDNIAAKQIANTIATSPLVKTAFYGGDANWGRIVAAAGRAGVALRPDDMELYITAGESTCRTDESLMLFNRGIAAEYDEGEATAIVNSPSVSLVLDCRIGEGKATVWTCDLSHDYVSINGHYRT